MSAVIARRKSAQGPHTIYLAALLNGCVSRRDGSQWLHRPAPPVEQRPFNSGAGERLGGSRALMKSVR